MWEERLEKVVRVGQPRVHRAAAAAAAAAQRFCRLSFLPDQKWLSISNELLAVWFLWKCLNQMRDKDFFRLMNIPLKDNNSSNLNAVLILNNCINT